MKNVRFCVDHQLPWFKAFPCLRNRPDLRAALHCWDHEPVPWRVSLPGGIRLIGYSHPEYTVRRKLARDLA